MTCDLMSSTKSFVQCGFLIFSSHDPGCFNNIEPLLHHAASSGVCVWTNGGGGSGDQWWS